MVTKKKCKNHSQSFGVQWDVPGHGGEAPVGAVDGRDEARASPRAPEAGKRQVSHVAGLTLTPCEERHHRKDPQDERHCGRPHGSLDEEVTASLPDLLCCLFADSGEEVKTGTHSLSNWEFLGRRFG